MARIKGHSCDDQTRDKTLIRTRGCGGKNQQTPGVRAKAIIILYSFLKKNGLELSGCPTPTTTAMVHAVVTFRAVSCVVCTSFLVGPPPTSHLQSLSNKKIPVGEWVRAFLNEPSSQSRDGVRLPATKTKKANGWGKKLLVDIPLSIGSF